MLKPVYRWLTCPFRIVRISRLFASDHPRILDVGCGNHSPRITKDHLPDCEYHGLHNSRWNLDAEDEQKADRILNINLENAGELDAIPRGAYDVVICSHVLEHLCDPYRVARSLAGRVCLGGLLYAETPSSRSTKLPRCANGWMRVKGCLNFEDDETHKGLVDLARVSDELRAAGFDVSRPRTCRLWRKILLLPAYVTACLFTKGFVPASVFWDITGFAQYVVAVKRIGEGRRMVPQRINEPNG